MKTAGWIVLGVTLALFALLGHSMAAAATSLVVADDASILDLLRPVYDALTGGHYAYGTVLGLIAVTALVKKYANIAWLHTDVGGSALVALIATLTALATGLAAPGASVTPAMLSAAFKVGLVAAGGYAFLKNILTAYVIPHLPAWAQKFLTPILWIFDSRNKPADVALNEAITAGAQAVNVSPPTGILGVVGSATEVK